MKLLLPLILLLGALAGAEAKLLLPRMPTPRFAPGVADGTGLLVGNQLRQQITPFADAGTVFISNDQAPASRSGPTNLPNQSLNTTDVGKTGAPVPITVQVGSYPVIDFTDNKYAPLAHDFIPEMLDWFDDLVARLGMDRPQLRDRGLRNNKVARLLRVFTAIRLHRDHTKDLGVAPAIGWCRIYLREDWGRFRRGETQALVMLATDRGWFVMDPYERRLTSTTGGKCLNCHNPHGSAVPKTRVTKFAVDRARYLGSETRRIHPQRQLSHHRR